MKQVRQLVARYGRDRVALAYARACYDAGAHAGRSADK